MIDPSFNAIRYAGLPLDGPSPIAELESGPPLEPLGPKPWEPLRGGFSREVREEITPIAERVLLRSMPLEIGVVPRTIQEKRFALPIVDYLDKIENQRFAEDLFEEKKRKRRVTNEDSDFSTWSASSSRFMLSEKPDVPLSNVDVSLSVKPLVCTGEVKSDWAPKNSFSSVTALAVEDKPLPVSWVPTIFSNDEISELVGGLVPLQAKFFEIGYQKTEPKEQTWKYEIKGLVAEDDPLPVSWAPTIFSNDEIATLATLAKSLMPSSLDALQAIDRQPEPKEQIRIDAHNFTMPSPLSTVPLSEKLVVKEEYAPVAKPWQYKEPDCVRLLRENLVAQQYIPDLPALVTGATFVSELNVDPNPPIYVPGRKLKSKHGMFGLDDSSEEPVVQDESPQPPGEKPSYVSKFLGSLFESIPADTPMTPDGCILYGSLGIVSDAVRHLPDLGIRLPDGPVDPSRLFVRPVYDRLDIILDAVDRLPKVETRIVGGVFDCAVKDLGVDSFPYVNQAKLLRDLEDEQSPRVPDLSNLKIFKF